MPNLDGIKRIRFDCTRRVAAVCTCTEHGLGGRTVEA